MKRIRVSLQYFYLLIGFIFLFLISLPHYSGDIKNHVAWGESLLNLGSYGFFDRTFPGYSFPTYPPLIMYSFALSFGLYQILMGATYFLNNALPFFPSNLIHWMEWENMLITFLKLPGLLATIIFAGVLPWILKSDEGKLSIKNPFLIYSLLILNPAIVYMSSVWGQTDLVQNLFILLALGFVIKKKFLWSFIFAGGGLMTKHTVLILWGVYIFYIFKEFGVKQTLKAISVSLLIFYLSYLPFHSLSLTWPLQFYYSNFTLVNFGVAENALNFWGFISNYEIISSEQDFLGIPFDLWGYILFLLPILPLTYLFYFKKTNNYHLFNYIFLISAFYFFFFARMHERYMIPVVLFATILVCLKNNLTHWLNLIFFSFLHFINLYRGLFQPSIPIISDLTESNLFLTILVAFYAVFLIYNYLIFLKELIRLPKREKKFIW